MNPWKTKVEMLRTQAERCLNGEPPTPAQATELAANVLAILDELEDAPQENHPYRTSGTGGEGQQGELGAAATLERALGETRARLAAAERALEQQKNLNRR